MTAALSVTAALFGLLAPVAAVWLSLLALRLRTVRDSTLVTLAVSVCVGLGLSSVTTFCCALIGIPLDGRFAVVDALTWTTIAVVAWRALRIGGVRADVGTARSLGPSARLTVVDWLVRAAFCAVAMVAVATIVAHGVAAPHGEWDAWAIWNQKARFLSRDIAHWTAVLDVAWSNPSHPLLVSLSVARLWAYAGTETTLAPAVLGGVWAAGTAAVVMGALDTRRRRAWIAGTVLIAPATFTQLAAAQTADLAVALFMVTTLVVLRSAVLTSTASDMRAQLLVAGVLGSLAAWTKNEGLVLVTIGTLIVMWTAARRARAGVVGWWLAGALPVGATILWHKLVVAPVPPEYLTEGPGAAATIAALFDPGRHAGIWALIGPRWMMWGGPLAIGALPLTIAAAAVATLTPGGRSARLIMTAVALLFASYYAIWLIAPLETVWLVATTFDRLLAQVWPSLVLVAFSAGAAAGAAPVPRPDALASSVDPK